MSWRIVPVRAQLRERARAGHDVSPSARALTSLGLQPVTCHRPLHQMEPRSCKCRPHCRRQHVSSHVSVPGQAGALTVAAALALVLVLAPVADAKLTTVAVPRQYTQERTAHLQLAQEPRLWHDAMMSGMRGLRDDVQAVLLWEDLGLHSIMAPPANGLWLPRSSARDKRPGAGTSVHGWMHTLFNTVNTAYEPSLPPRKLEDTDVKIEHSGVKALGLWWSNRGLPREATTVAVTASINRLGQLYSQCRTWPGPLSVALYQPLLADGSGGLGAINHVVLRAAAAQVVQFLSEAQQLPHACKPDIILVWEMYADDEARTLLYPYNILRNLARLQVRTPLIALMDVDLVLSRQLYVRLCRPGVLASSQMLEQARNKTVFIVAAFDVSRRVDRTAWADALASGRKDMMVYSLLKGVVYPFDKPGFPQGHNLTNYKRWARASQDYVVKYGHQNEPWIVGDRLLLPWHDARYRGYGRDKVQFVSDVAAKGFTFKVMHNTFVIHREHRVSDAKHNYLRRDTRFGDRPNPFTTNVKLFDEQVALQRQGKPFVSPEHPVVRNGKAMLPWWQPAAPGG